MISLSWWDPCGSDDGGFGSGGFRIGGWAYYKADLGVFE